MERALNHQAASATSIVELTPSYVAEYRRLAGERGAESGDTAGLTPPTIASAYVYPIIAEMSNGVGGAILAAQHFGVGRECRIGDVLTTTVRSTETYERRGNQFMVVETVTSNQAGGTVLISRLTRMLPEASPGSPEGDRQ